MIVGDSDVPMNYTWSVTTNARNVIKPHHTLHIDNNSSPKLQASTKAENNPLKKKKSWIRLMIQITKI